MSLQSYRQAWSEAGHTGTPSAYVRIPVYAAATEHAALEEPRESIAAFFERQSALARTSVGRAGAGPAEQRSFQAERMANLSYEDVLEKKVAFGTPAQLIARLTKLRDQLGIDGILLEPNSGGLIPPEKERESLRLFTHEVIPAFRRS